MQSRVGPSIVLAIAVLMPASALFAATEISPSPPTASGDGRIYIIPSLSAPSVKNGGKLVVSAVVKAAAGVREIVADLGGVETVSLRPSSAQSGGVNADQTLGLWQAEWTAHSLEEKIYAVTVRVTDRDGHAFEDSSCSFSDPAAGLSAAGANTYVNGALARQTAVTMGTGEASLFCASIDTDHGFVYFGTLTSPGQVIKMSLNATGAPTLVGKLTLNTGENSLYSSAIDTANGYIYYGTLTSPGIVVKVSVNGSGVPTRVGALTMNTGENSLYSAVLDTTNGYGYFGTGTSPGIVVKVNLGGAGAPTRSAALTLSTGENALRFAVVDAAAGYAYFTTDTFPGRVVKVALNGTGAHTRVGAVTMSSGENQLRSGVIDPVNGYAYFATITNPSIVVKVALNGAAAPTRVGALTLAANERQLISAVIDAPNGYAYFGAYTSPGLVFKIALNGSGAPLNAGKITLNTGENNLVGIALDATAGALYFSTDTNPGIVIRTTYSQKGLLNATKLTMPETGKVTDVRLYSHTAGGNVRLSIYDNASPKNLVWQSASVANTVAGGEVVVAVAAGSPSSLVLAPGTYWLAYQVDTAARVGSYTAGSAGDGFNLPLAYGSAPATVSGETSSAERWTQYITYNVPPTVANVIPDQNATEDAAFSFAFASNTFSDVDLDVLTYTATLSDGSALPAWLTFTPATRTFSGTPLNADVGLIDIKVTATDPSAQGVSDTFTLTVANTNDAPTVANAIANQIAGTNDLFVFNVPANTFADVDVGDSLVFGARLAGGAALPAWLAFDPATRTFSGTPGLADQGALQVTVTAVDAGALSCSATFTLAVARRRNTAPQFASGVLASVNPARVGERIDFSGASDAENDPLQCRWNFGDGTSGDGVNTSHTYTHAGTFSVTAAASDGVLSADASIAVVVIDPNGYHDGDDDGDGFPNDLELAAGTSPGDAGSTPANIPTHGDPRPFSLQNKNLKITLDYKRGNKDCISVSGTLPVYDGPSQGNLLVGVGGVYATAEFSGQVRRIETSAGSAQMKLSMRRGVGPRDVRFSLKIVGDLKSLLPMNGGVEAPQQVPVLILLDGRYYGESARVQYKVVK